ncbi:MAG: DUF3796 domain-containing protein [Tissierellia bacterium]|nr:DUF3796 domain-containing protein [Tissierellia bacterium]
MDKSTFKEKILSKVWVGGFLGFFGFTKLFIPEIESYFMFMFFIFFAWYWNIKIDGEIVDERLLENKLKASSYGFGVSFLVIYIIIILLNSYTINFFPFLESIEARYDFLTAIVVLSLALGVNLTSYLTYKYEVQD